VNIYGVSTLATVAYKTKCMLFLTAILIYTVTTMTTAFFSRLQWNNSLFTSSPPLEVDPLKSRYGVWGSAVSSPSRVWGGAAAEIDFGAF